MTRRVAVITGASSGIGETFARKLSSRGYSLVLVARRAERLANLASELGNSEAFPADLTRDSDVESVARRIASDPDLDMLVNNAGFGTLGFFHEADPLAEERMHRLHVLATLKLTQAALPGMVERRSGSIINVSSVAAFFRHNVSYCATKAWINAFTEGLHVELSAAGSPVRLQALCPGFTHTEFHDVLGIGRNFTPEFTWMTADKVVESSLRALETNRVIVIPGLLYRSLVRLYAPLPRSLKHAIAKRYTLGHHPHTRREK